MEQFIELIDNYMSNYNSFKKGKISLNCDYGELIFLKQNDNILIIYGIFILPQYRGQGLCRNILQYLIDNVPDNFKYICVEAVISKVLYEYLLRFTYKNKKFKNTKNGFILKIE